MAGMSKTTKAEAQIEVLHAAVLALCVSLTPERAAVASRMFSAALASTDAWSSTSAPADAAAAGKVALILKTLELLRAADERRLAA
jgi:hypothetical protein